MELFVFFAVSILFISVGVGRMVHKEEWAHAAFGFCMLLCLLVQFHAFMVTR